MFLDLFARNLFTNNLSHGLLQYFVSSSTDARKGWVHLNIRNNAELSSTRITILRK